MIVTIDLDACHPTFFRGFLVKCHPLSAFGALNTHPFLSGLFLGYFLWSSTVNVFFAKVHAPCEERVSSQALPLPALHHVPCLTSCMRALWHQLCGKLSLHSPKINAIQSHLWQIVIW